MKAGNMEKSGLLFFIERRALCLPIKTYSTFERNAFFLLFFFLMGQYEAAVSFYNKFRRLGIRQKLIVTTTVDKMKMYKQGLFRINATLAWR